MLAIFLSPNQLAAALLQDDQLHYLSWGVKGEWKLNSHNPEEDLLRRLPDLLAEARNAPGFSFHAENPCQVMVATAIHADSSELRVSLNAAIRNSGAEDFQLTQVDAMVWPFLYGGESELQPGQKAVVLMGLGKSVEWVEAERKAMAALPSTAELGARALFREEKVAQRRLPQFGPEFGREKVLAHLMKQFSQAGLNLDAATQTELARQISHEPLPAHFQISRQVGNVTIEAEAHFSIEDLSALMLGDYQALKAQLDLDQLRQHGVSQIWLMGSYLHHPQFISFLKETCQLNALLHLPAEQTERAVWDQTAMGLHTRLKAIEEAEAALAEAEAKKREAEAKKAAIAAELKMKDERDLLLQEIKDTCTRPGKREEYETMFVSRGAALGIPDLVIRWNITEALSRVELVQEGEEVGLRMEEAVPAVAVAPPAPVEEPAPVIEQLPAPEPPVADQPEVVVVKEEEPQAPVVPAPAPVIMQEPEPQPVPVLEPVMAGGPAVAEAVMAKTAVKPSRKREQVSMDDIFTWKGELPDADFISRKATFHQDGDVKVVRILEAGLISNGEAVGNFRKVYEKELAYFGEMSEMSEAREGMYFYRKYVERQTLREFAQRNGLANKKGMEDLSSADLKFILMLLKEVQLLPVSHGNLNPDNILVLNKRKWNLSKDLEIRFVEFSPKDLSPEASIAQAHTALGEVIGPKVYSEFKEKFQL